MDKHVLKILVFLGFGVFSIAIAAVPAGAAGNEALIKGQILSEKCMESGASVCYLESASDGKIVILTSDRKLYKVETHRAPQWKIDGAFGKQVVVKGVLKGNKILVNDVVMLGGKRKLSKACI